ncbi:MAG: hypothetical protein GY853_10395 [PVC group bacterium]|nr:hypothetical protein [PVC group bacterium]
METISLNKYFSQKTIKDNISSTLKEIEIYKKCKINVESVSTADIIPLSKYVKNYRLVFTEKFMTSILKYNLTPFDPIILFNDGLYRLIFPPILEKQKEALFIIDGTHRVFMALKNNIKYINLVTIQGCNLPDLPCKPSTWFNIKMTSKRLNSEQMIESSNMSNFRPVSSLMNSDRFSFKSIDEIKRYFFDRS